VRRLASSGLKHLHSGLAQLYLFFMVAGTLAILLYLVT